MKTDRTKKLVVVLIAMLLVGITFSVIQIIEAFPGTPNPGHPASEIGSGIFYGVAADVWSFPGNVGVGTTGPGAKLVVQGPNSSSVPIMRITDGTINAGFFLAASEPKLQWGTETNNSMSFFTNNLNRMAINAAGGVGIGSGTYLSGTPPAGGLIIEGNVGIGTTGPAEKLEVAGNLKLKPSSSANPTIIGTYSGGSTYNEILMYEPGTANMFFRTNYSTAMMAFQTGGSNTRMAISSGGNVGIGDTTPAALLTVGSGDLFRVDSSGNLVRINNVLYSWPTAQGLANTYLKNDGAGTLSWSAVTGGIAACSDCDSQFVNVTGDTMTGDLTVGSIGRGANTYIGSVSGDAYNAGLEAYGSSQGTGYLYVGQSTTYGGGIFYNGDGTPAFATGEAADIISFYRKNAGANEVVFSYPYNSNDVSFRGNIIVAGILNCNTVDTTASGQLICGTDAVDDTVSWSEISGIVGTAANTVAAGDDSRFHTRNRDYALTASDGSPIDAVYVDADGKVGIGTATPASYQLKVINPSAAFPAGGIYGQGAEYGVRGEHTGTTGGAGVYGKGKTGVEGFSADGIGVVGTSSSGNGGFFSSDTGIPLRVFDEPAADTTPFIIDADGNVGIGIEYPTAKLEVACPSGFTNIKASNNQLGCMQTAEQGSANWEIASDTCFDTYGGRLPTSGEWYIAMANYTLTDETDDWEWNNDGTYYSTFDQHIVSGLSTITIQTYNNDANSTAYRCWLPR